MRKLLNVFLAFSFLMTTLSPSYAGLLNSTDAVETHFETIESLGTLKTAQTFKGEEGKTAAGILHYSDKDGETHVLLGLRDDTKTWCNFGGKTDGDEYMHETAAREVSEESNGIYATHPGVVKNFPYIDLLNSQETYFRMYWQEVPYVPAEQLLAKMQSGAGGHNAEYTEFKWVPISHLSKMTELYQHLGEILNTYSGQKFLKLLSHNPKALSPLMSHVSHLKNRLFVFDIDAQPNKEGRLSGDIKRSFFKKDDVWFYQDHIFPLKEKTQPRALEISKEMAEKQLANAVSAHTAAMAHIKKRQALANGPLFEPIKLNGNPITNPDLDPNLWLSDPRYTLTRCHLRLAMGDQYNDAGTRDGDLENLKNYYGRYGGTDEFKHDTEAHDEDYEVLADAMAFEAAHPWPVFFHAADDQLNQLWQSFTKTLGIANGNPMTHSLRLRGTDIYFNPRLDPTSGALTPLDTMENVNRVAQGGDYNNGRASIILCANQGMTPGLKTTSTTSSSLAYFLSNHSVESQSCQDRFAESFALSGFDEPNYEPYRALFDQYMNAQHGQKSNSVMLAVAVNPEALNDLVYPSHGGGRPFDVPSTHQKDQMTQAILASLHHIQQAAMARQPGMPVNLNELKKLYSEVRILLSPEKFYDPAFVNVKGFSRFPLSNTVQTSYDKSMEQLSIETLSEWLASNNSLIEGAWHAEPTSRILYRMVYPGVFGEPVRVKNGRKGFLYLINNNMMDAAKVVMTQDPSLQELLQSPTQVQDLAHALLAREQVSGVVQFMRGFNVPYAFLASNQDTMNFMEFQVSDATSGTGLAYLLENYYTEQNPLSAVFNSKILPNISDDLGDCFYNETPDGLLYLQLLFENITNKQKEILLAKILYFGPVEDVFKKFIDALGTSDAKKRQIVADYYPARMKNGFFYPNKIVEFVEQYFPTKELAMALNPKTNEPYLFEFLLLDFYGVKPIVEKWNLQTEANAYLKTKFERGEATHSSLDALEPFWDGALFFDPQMRQWYATLVDLGHKVDGSVDSMMAFFQHMEQSISQVDTTTSALVPYIQMANLKVAKSGSKDPNMDLKALVDLVVTSGDKKTLMDYLEGNAFIRQLFRNVFTGYSFATHLPQHVDLHEMNRQRYLKIFQPFIDVLQSPEPIPSDVLQNYLQYPQNPMAWRYYMTKHLLENVKRENLKTVLDFLYPGDKAVIYQPTRTPVEISLTEIGHAYFAAPQQRLEDNPYLTPTDILEYIGDRSMQQLIMDRNLLLLSTDIFRAFMEDASLQNYPLVTGTLVSHEELYRECLFRFTPENVRTLISHDYDAFKVHNARGMLPPIVSVFIRPQCFELSKELIDRDPSLILDLRFNGTTILKTISMYGSARKNFFLTFEKLYAYAVSKQEMTDKK